MSRYDSPQVDLANESLISNLNISTGIQSEL